MTRGNQRDRDREKAQKKAQGQKGKTTTSGTQMQRDKEAAAEIMRQKQAKAPALRALLHKPMFTNTTPVNIAVDNVSNTHPHAALEKKAAEAAAAGSKK